MTETIKTNRIIRVGSRESRLAVIQSELVIEKLILAFPGIRTELVTMKTAGDKILDKTLDRIGGKGLFVKELDEALLNGTVDITVHSLKDLPQDIPEALPVLAWTEREDPRDVLVLPEGKTEPDLSLPLGTSSLRRALQVSELYPGAETAPVRGNVLTRLRKLDEGQYSGLILAAAGLKRLGLEHRISRYFTHEDMIPAPCQGVLAVQARSSDADIAEMILPAVNSRESELTSTAERAFVRSIGADCGSPDTAFSWMEGDTMHMTGLRYDVKTGSIIRDKIIGIIDAPGKGGTIQADQLGINLAEKLMGKQL